MTSRRPDPVRLEVFHHLLSAVCEEAGALLQQSAISPNIRERQDFSFALFDRDARLVAQAAHIPVHLGSAGDAVRAARARLTLERGDVAILNDPFDGGTHLPDITMLRPVFFGRDKQASFFLVNRAHHADVGGAVPGSMGIATDLHGEGLVIPPVKLRARGARQDAVVDILRANVRHPDERLIDLNAQEASLELAESRLRALCEEHGRRVVLDYATRHLPRYSATIARAVVSALRPGRYLAEDRLESDGLGSGPLTVRLALRIRAGTLQFDYRTTDDQARGGVNANRSIAVAASVYVLRCLCPPRVPTNEGLFDAVEVLTRPGSLLDPHRPAAVAGGNVETSQRIVDVALDALAAAVPDRAPAASAGTMSNLTIGGDGFALYETLPGGAGAGPAVAGASAVQTHMTNTKNTPVEDLETHHPVRVRSLTVRRGSGGGGARRGGDGIVKEIEALAPLTVSLFADRHELGPPGRAGGADGKPGVAWRIDAQGRRRRVPAKTSVRLLPGERLRIETPGGGGHGSK